MTSQVNGLPSVEEFDRYDNNLTLMEFIIGLPMFAVFFFFGLPTLNKIDIILGFFIGSVIVLSIFIIPVKLASLIVKPEWETCN